MPKSDTLCSRSVRKDGGYRASSGCIESGDDLVPNSWSAFGRTVRVGVDGCLTGLENLFSSHRALRAWCEEDFFNHNHTTSIADKWTDLGIQSGISVYSIPSLLILFC